MTAGKINYSHRRTIFLAGVYLLIGIHIAHWKLHGSTLAPLEFNEVLYTIHLGIITAGFIFMALALLGTLVFGRFFCSWGCHILALEDLSAWMLKKINIRPKPIRSRVMKLIPVFALVYLFIWPQVLRLINHQPLPTWKILNDKEGWASFITTDFWRNLPGIGITALTFFFGGFFIIYLLGSRSFCRNVCPYGAVFSLADRIAPGKIKLTGSCDQCGLCTANCSSNIAVHKELHQFGRVVNPQCLKDLDCVQACPNDAIKFGFGKPSFFLSLNENENPKSKYDLTIAEDIFIVISVAALFFVFRGLFDKVPFLLAITLALAFGFMFLMMIRMFRTEFVRISNYVFKQGNKITSHGKLFLTAGSFAMLVVFYCAFIQYHTIIGYRAYNNFIDEISKKEEAKRFAGEVGTYSNQAIEHLQVAEKFSLASSPKIYRELGYLYQQRGEYENAEFFLRKCIDENSENNEVRIQFVQVLLHNSKKAEAASELKMITDLDKNNLSVRDKKIIGDANFCLAQIEEENRNINSALVHYQTAASFDPSNSAAFLAAGTIFFRNKNFAEAERCMDQCVKLDSESPVIHNNLSALYINTGQTEKAIEQLNILKYLQPANPQHYFNLGILLYKSGRIDEAGENFKHTLELQPDNRAAHDALELVKRNSKRILSLNGSSDIRQKQRSTN